MAGIVELILGKSRTPVIYVINGGSVLNIKLTAIVGLVLVKILQM